MDTRDGKLMPMDGVLKAYDAAPAIESEAEKKAKEFDAGMTRMLSEPPTENADGKVKVLVEADVPPLEKGHFVKVNRDLTERETMEQQIRMYSPCGCGSGKKFKFCCFKKS
jgi:hypothetical protein